MNCRGCGYALWNLRDRRCPECGRAFLPSEFDFVPNSVRFQCPHCNQAYYGTGAKGHLEPKRFACLSCHHEVDMDEMLLLPTEGVKEEQTVVRRIPWLERSRRGFFRGWLGTVGMALVRPTALIRGAEPVAAGSAFWFALLNAMVPLLIACIAAGAMMVFAGPFLFGFAAFAGVGFALYVVFIGIWGLLAHGILLATGRVAGGPLRTFRPILLASAPVIFCSVPCVGPYLAPVALIWWVIAAVIMLVDSQRVGVLRAILAGGLFPVLLAGAAIGLMIYGMVMAISFATSAARFNAISAAVASSLSLDLQTYANANNGQLPPHALDVLLMPGGRSTGVIDPASGTTSDSIPVGGTTLDQVFVLPAPARAAVARAAAQALPPSVIAHRLGDVVFTYHGITLPAPNSGLWLFVVWPANTGASGPAQPGATVHVGTTDGRNVTIPLVSFGQVLPAQNVLRQQAGLAPLPHPSTVTHEQPATGP